MVAIGKFEWVWKHDASYMRDMINASRGAVRAGVDAAADVYREAIVKRWGRRAFVSLAFAVTAARIYPTVKYAPGPGKAWMGIVVGGTAGVFDHGRVPARADVAGRTV